MTTGHRQQKSKKQREKEDAYILALLGPQLFRAISLEAKTWGVSPAAVLRRAVQVYFYYHG